MLTQNLSSSILRSDTKLSVYYHQIFCLQQFETWIITRAWDQKYIYVPLKCEEILKYWSLMNNSAWFSLLIIFLSVLSFFLKNYYQNLLLEEDTKFYTLDLLDPIYTNDNKYLSTSTTTLLVFACVMMVMQLLKPGTSRSEFVMFWTTHCSFIN